MTMQRIVPLVFILFTGFTLWVLATSNQNFLTWFLGLFTTPESLQVVLDLAIALLLVMYLLYRDHQSQGGGLRSFLPFVIATPLLGVIAPLAYLSLRSWWPTMLQSNTKKSA